jgi:hypothetical protein
MRAIHAMVIGCVAAATLGGCVFASPAQADWGGRYHRWHPHDGWRKPSGAPALIVAQPPYHYVPAAAYKVAARAYDPPPPVAYGSPPAYYAPAVPFGLTVR